MAENKKELGFGGPDGPKRADGGSFKFTPYALVSEKNDSNRITRDYLDSFVLEYRFIDSQVPSTEMTLFGETFSTPIMVGGMSAVVPHLHPNGMSEMALGALAVNTPVFTGYLSKAEFAKVCATGAKAVRIIKPQRDNDAVLADIRHDEEHGAFAFALDVDHCFAPDGGYFPGNPDYGELGPKSLEELRMFCRATRLPCIVKGVLSVQDAIKCVEAGAAGILISHHKGELPDAVPPLYALPKIREAVGNRIKLFVDCGLTSGMDVYKVLARGADAVCVARALVPGFKDQGREGVAAKLTQLNLELRGAMARTGSRDILHIDPTTVIKKDW